MKDSGWNRDGKSIFNYEPVLTNWLRGIRRLNLALMGKNWISDVCCGWTYRHPVTDSLLSPVERVGSWVYLGLSDRLIDTQKKAHDLVRHVVKGTKGPG